MNKTQIISIIVIVLVVALGAFYITNLDESDNGSDSNGDVVATVNDEEISRSEFNEFQSQVALQQGFDPSTLDEQGRSQLQTQVLDTLISQTLLRQAAKRSDVSVSDAELETQIDTIRGQFEGEEAFEEALGQENITEEELIENVRTDLVLQAYLDSTLDLESISATDEEISEAYDEVSANQDVPPLEEIREQIEGFVIEQKQQEMIAALVDELRDEAEIEILI